MNVDWMFAITVLVTGVLVVFLALLALVGMIYAMGYVMNMLKGNSGSKPSAPAKSAPAPAPKAAAPKAAPKAAMQVEDGIEEEVVAVISAAIAAMMSAEGVPAGSYTVKSVKRAREARPAWAMAGMQQNTRPF
jgi:sodium pump decarboxylase gamma subunit